MKPEFTVSFLAAVTLHALLLFAWRLETPARPLPLSEEPSAVDVSLVEAPPEAPSEPPAPTAAPARPEPASTPEPQPTPEMSTPPAASTPEQETIPAPESTPAPPHPKASPHRPRTEPRPQAQASAPSRPAAPHSAPGLAGHGATSGPLSSHARYLSNPKPDYPEEARQRRQQGVVMVSIEVTAEGRPGEVSLSRSSGFPLLDAAALEAVRRWTFDPARSAGFPVASRVEVPVRFSLAR